MYATTNFAGFGPPKANPITVTFPVPVTNFAIDVLNGRPVTLSYEVSDSGGHNSTVTLSSNNQGGQALVNLPAPVSRVSIAAISGLPNYDFLIDDISFNTAIPPPVTQTATVVGAFSQAIKEIFVEHGADNLHAAQQQLMDCASDITCNNLDEQQQNVQQQNLKLIGVVDNAATSSTNFVLSTPFDPFNKVDIGIAVVTGQLKDIAENIIDFFKLLGDPPPTIIDAYGTGRHIALPGLIYNAYNLEVTFRADLNDLQFLHIGDRLFIDTPVFDSSLRSFGDATIDAISLINGTARFKLEEIEVQRADVLSVPEPGSIFIFAAAMLFFLLIIYVPTKLDIMSSRKGINPC